MSSLWADTGKSRRVLMLQGPHGPFFYWLSRQLRQNGADVWRVGFNLADRALWPSRHGYIAYQGAHEDWPKEIELLLARYGITDLVLYGDARPIHQAAIAAAHKAGLRVHVFEEGYLRPYWITYERDGANGYSHLMDIPIEQMREALRGAPPSQSDAPALWGDLRQHMFWGAAYHGFVLGGFWSYSRFRPHRSLTVGQEFVLYCRRFALAPLYIAERYLAERRIKTGGFPYHLVLLQLEHDTSFRVHSPFSSQTEFLAVVMKAFHDGAAKSDHLVFKAHPLEDGRAPIADEIARLSALYNLKGRVHFVRGGKLARLLTRATAVVTVNSTAAQQALWRGLPLKALGTAIYAKPGLVSPQPLDAFFASPQPPDRAAYEVLRSFLLKSSQIRGGYYSRKGRRTALKTLVGKMLSPHSPYAFFQNGDEEKSQS